MSITDAMSRLVRAELGVMLETIYAESLWPGMTFEDKDDTLQQMHYQDCREFVRAFSDPAPIDEAWLREMGDGTEWDVVILNGGLQFDMDGESMFVMTPTRGRFRALLHGLGMEVRR